MSVNNNFGISKTLGALLVGVVVVYVTSTYIIDRHTQTVKDSVQILVTEQASVVSTLAEITSRGGADSVAESIITDCPSEERTKFDNLLGKLNSGLRTSELSELERLFNRCGNFFAKRKAVMVSRLDREVAVLKNYVDLLSQVSGVDKSEAYKIDNWAELVRQEQSQSAYFNELVILQGEIIVSLVNGSTPTSEEIKNLLSEVSRTQRGLSDAIVETSNLRSELIAI